MIGAGLGLISSVLGMIMSGNANSKTRGELDRLAANQKLPPSLLSAEALLREQATTGLPGYENQTAEIGSGTAQTINQMKDYVSGGGLIKAVADMTTKANERQRSLDDANNAAMLENKGKLAGFLGNTKARAEQELQDNLNSIATAKMGINQAGVQDALNFTNLGLGAIGNDRGLLSMINKWIGNSGGGGSIIGNDSFNPSSPTFNKILGQTVPASGMPGTATFDDGADSPYGGDYQLLKYYQDRTKNGSLTDSEQLQASNLFQKLRAMGIPLEGMGLQSNSL